MSERDQYPPNVPCYVDMLTEDLEAAKRFYGGIFGWEFAGPGPVPGDPPGAYFVARVRGRDVAGIGSTPVGSGPSGSAPGGAGTMPPAWNTHVSVDSADDAAARAQAAGATIVVAPFDVPPAGRLAVLADPAGAVFCVWEAADRPGAALVNEPSAWAMSLLSTADPETATAFYGELFGWRAEAFDAGSGMEAWLWRLPGFVGGEPGQPVPRDVVAAMMRTDPAAAVPPAWGVDFWIDDADAAAGAAPELGGAVLAAPFESPPFRRAILADPSGAPFSVSQLKLAA